LTRRRFSGEFDGQGRVGVGSSRRGRTRWWLGCGVEVEPACPAASVPVQPQPWFVFVRNIGRRLDRSDWRIMLRRLYEMEW
jgi:hypothetical protein